MFFKIRRGVLYLPGLGCGGRVLCQRTKNMCPKRTFAKNLYNVTLKAKGPKATRGLRIGVQVCRSAMHFNFEPPNGHQDNSLDARLKHNRDQKDNFVLTLQHHPDSPQLHHLFLKKYRWGATQTQHNHDERHLSLKNQFLEN